MVIIQTEGYTYNMSLNKEIAMVKLPQSRSVWAICMASFILCFIFYYFYGGYLTMALIMSVLLGKSIYILTYKKVRINQLIFTSNRDILLCSGCAALSSRFTS